MKLLILGASGMLGRSIFNFFRKKRNISIVGICRDSSKAKKISAELRDLQVISDFTKKEILEKIIFQAKPDVVINCVGIIKQINSSSNDSNSKLINSDFPHLIQSLQKNFNFRFIHYSTDCVFNGDKGDYKEEDKPNCRDVYGLTKLKGEITKNNKCLTIRTSIIGHELNSNISLLDWFLSTKGEIEGFSKAFFSGLTSLEHAKVLEKFIIPNKKLSGLFHLSGDKIDKYSLLKLASEIYNHDVKIKRNTSFRIDRSLNSKKFNRFTGYNPPSWEKMLEELRDFFGK